MDPRFSPLQEAFRRIFRPWPYPDKDPGFGGMGNSPIPHGHLVGRIMVGVQKDAGDDGGGDPLRLVPRPEEERREGVDHQVGEFLGEPPEGGGGPPSLTPRAIMILNMTRIYI